MYDTAPVCDYEYERKRTQIPTPRRLFYQTISWTGRKDYSQMPGFQSFASLEACSFQNFMHLRFSGQWVKEPQILAGGDDMNQVESFVIIYERCHDSVII